MRLFTTISLLALLFTAIGYLFYSQEVQYWIPTPIPQDYHAIPIGSKIEPLEFSNETKKFFHFYNPNCPCSKFNTRNYKSLIRRYSTEFDCYVVIQRSLEGLSSSDKAFLKELSVQVIVDIDKELAKKLGVYATPQMVLLDEMDRVYYRGNYNLARYCTNSASNYAKMAIDSMLNGSQYEFPATAFTAYGCDLDKQTD